MKLLSIRLHPFGGTTNRTCTLHDGLNVLEGPNEFGKSTLSNAVWHALFTPSNLPPKTQLKTIGRWYPLPVGDHARVTVQFQADGQLWTLQKTWGAGASSSLQAEGFAGISDADKVQNQLHTFLRRNEATWRHVLFTSQAQLAATMEQLRANAKLRDHAEKVDEVQSLLAGPAAIPGDIAPDKLSTEVEKVVSAHFSQWDRTTNGPKEGRGIDREWKQKVGPQLQAYYAMEKVRRKMIDVIQHEQAVDDINAQIHRISGEMASDEEFIRTGRTLRDGLGKRSGLEERCKRLTGELRLLKEIMTAWPGAALVMQSKETELTALARDFESVEAELKHARKRGQAEQLRVAHERLSKAKEEWQRVVAHLAESKAIAPELLKELKLLEPEIERLRIQISAQKLTAKLESATSRTVTVQRGTGEAETITLSPASLWESQADGLFCLEFQDLKLRVESGTGDVNALFTALEAARNRQAEILETLGHESLAAAQLADADHQKRVDEERTQNGLYRSTLQGRSEEEWTADLAALTDLPETRSVEVLDGERTRLLGRKAALELEIRQLQEKIEKWTRDFLNLESLTDKILTHTAESNQATQELAGLPELPEGFASIPAYLDLLARKEATREQQDERLSALKVERGRLIGAAPANTAEELQSELEIKQREFDRQQADGQALLRIQAKLQSVIADRGIDDPMQGLTTAVSNHFRDLTGGRYKQVTLDGTSPTQVGGACTLDTALLSQGTLGSLALATRLALSELYLKDMEGFFLLDDPFTDMDTTRRAAAIQAIGTFAENHQVLFFTCHPEHAGELQLKAAARNLKVTA